MFIGRFEAFSGKAGRLYEQSANQMYPGSTRMCQPENIPPGQPMPLRMFPKLSSTHARSVFKACKYERRMSIFASSFFQLLPRFVRDGAGLQGFVRVSNSNAAEHASVGQEIYYRGIFFDVTAEPQERDAASYGFVVSIRRQQQEKTVAI